MCGTTKKYPVLSQNGQKSGYIRLIFATCRISQILTNPAASKIHVLDSLLTRQIRFKTILYNIVSVYYPWTVGFHFQPCVHSSQSYTESAIICLEFRKFVVCNCMFSTRFLKGFLCIQCMFHTISPTYCCRTPKWNGRYIRYFFLHKTFFFTENYESRYGIWLIFNKDFNCNLFYARQTNLLYFSSFILMKCAIFGLVIYSSVVF